MNIVEASLNNIEKAIKHQTDWWNLSSNDKHQFVEETTLDRFQIRTLQISVHWLGFKWNNLSWLKLDPDKKRLLVEFAQIILKGNSTCWFTGKLTFEGELWGDVFYVAKHERKWRLIKHDEKKLKPIRFGEYSFSQLNVICIANSFFVMEYWRKNQKCTIFINPFKEIVSNKALVIPDLVCVTDKRNYNISALSHLEVCEPPILCPKDVSTVFFNCTQFEGSETYILNAERCPSAFIRVFATSSNCKKNCHTHSVAFSFLYREFQFVNVIILGQYYCGNEMAIANHFKKIKETMMTVHFLFVSLDQCLKFKRTNALEILTEGIDFLSPSKIFIFERNLKVKENSLFEQMLEDTGFSLFRMEKATETTLFRFENFLQNK